MIGPLVSGRSCSLSTRIKAILSRTSVYLRCWVITEFKALPFGLHPGSLRCPEFSIGLYSAQTACPELCGEARVDLVPVPDSSAAAGTGDDGAPTPS